MRDAFGGAFMIKLFLIFIIIYVGFTAVSLNYAKAFKVKNKVISYLEDNEIIDISNMTAEAKTEMENYFEHEILGNMNYKIEQDVFNAKCKQIIEGKAIDPTSDNSECFEPGIIIVESGKSINPNRVYYSVYTYVGWSIPFLNKLLALSQNEQDTYDISGYWTISGETRIIIND